MSHAVRLWELTRPANPAPLAIEIALGPFYGTAAVQSTMIPVRAPQDGDHLTALNVRGRNASPV